MKSFFQLIVVKNWRTYAILFAVLLVLGGVLKLLIAEQNRLIELPVAVQNFDDSESSKQLMTALKKQPRFHVTNLSTEERYPEDEVAKQRAVAVVIIPDDYEKRLAARQTSGVLTLYVQHNMVGDIVTETISKTAYKQQLPYIVAQHLKVKNIALEDVFEQYKKVEPKGQLTMRSLVDSSPQSLGLAAVIIVMLLVGVAQIGLNRALCQPQALARVRIYETNYRKFYMVYVAAHSFVLVVGALGLMMLIGLSVSATAIFILLAAAVVFEIGVALLLTHVRTWSHQLFMALILAMTLAVIIILLQLGGVA